jgi:hypothetical protein
VLLRTDAGGARRARFEAALAEEDALHAALFADPADPRARRRAYAAVPGEETHDRSRLPRAEARGHRGTRGLGKAIAMSLARTGATVFVTHRWGSVEESALAAEFAAEGLAPPTVVESDASDGPRDPAPARARPAGRCAWSSPTSPSPRWSAGSTS